MRKTQKMLDLEARYDGKGITDILVDGYNRHAENGGDAFGALATELDVSVSTLWTWMRLFRVEIVEERRARVRVEEVA